METQVTVIADHGATPAADPHADDAMLRSVQRVIRVEQVVALAILVVILGLFAIAFFGNPSVGAFIIGAIVAFLAFGICGLVAENFFFKPYRSIAFAACRRRLNAELTALSPAMAHVWKAPLPGSIAISGGKLMVKNWDSGYTRLQVEPSDILEVKVERTTTLHTTTKHSGRFTYGTGKSIFGAYTTGGKSRSTTRAVDEATLEVHLRNEDDGSVYAMAIPFGTDRRAADAFCTAVAALRTRSVA